MLVSINDVVVKKRVRKDLGDLHPLMESMQRYGLLNPITITDKYELIAGHRRLESAKNLGWEAIQANMISSSNKLQLLEMEMEENVQRQEFTEAELLDGYAQLEKLRNPNIFRKMWFGIKNFFTKSFDVVEARKVEKRRKNILLSLLTVLGIILLIVGSTLGRTNAISSIFHSFLDIFSLILIVCGIFFFSRFLIGFNTKEK